jgi:hypothetical protein
MMKKLLFLSLFFFCIISTKAQFGQVVEADSTNFEVNDSLAQIDATAGNIWQIGLPMKTFFGTSYSAPFAIMTDSVNPYPVNNLSTFTIKMDSALNGSFPDAYVSFWHKYNTDTLKDGGFVEFSADSGVSWVNVIDAYSIGVQYMVPTNFYSATDTILGDIPAFSGTQNTWQYSKIFLQWFIPLLQPFNGGERDIYYTDRVMFRFNFKSDNVNTSKAGWIIDNLEIGYNDPGGGIVSHSKSSFEVQLFPNPMESQSIIQVVSPLNGMDFRLSLQNSLGQIILIKEMDNNNQFIIEKSNLKSGIYFYSITNKTGENKTGKLIIK